MQAAKTSTKTKIDLESIFEQFSEGDLKFRLLAKDDIDKGF